MCHFIWDFGDESAHSSSGPTPEWSWLPEIAGLRPRSGGGDHDDGRCYRAAIGPPGQQLADLFSLHQLELVRLAYLLVRDRPTAEDIVQDVFARLYERNGRVGRPGQELA